VLGRRPVRAVRHGDADVDPPLAAAERDGARRFDARDRNAEVPRQKIAGAPGDDAEGGIPSAQCLSHGAHGAVAARREHEGRAPGQRLADLRLPALLRRRLEPEQFEPAGSGGLHRRPDARNIDPHGVVDDGGDAALLPVPSVHAHHATCSASVDKLVR